MRKPLLAAMMMTLAIGACGRLNPMNWFGESAPVPVVAPEQATVADTRPLIAQVTALRIEETPDGAIVRAVGVPPTQGYWNAGLVARPVSGGVLIYDFHAVPPDSPMQASTQASREVTVAAGVTRAQLAGVQQIVVQGATNALTSAR